MYYKGMGSRAYIKVQFFIHVLIFRFMRSFLSGFLVYIYINMY